MDMSLDELLDWNEMVDISKKMKEFYHEEAERKAKQEQFTKGYK